MLNDGGVKFGINLPQVFPSGKVDAGLVSTFASRAEALGYHSGWSLDLTFTGMPILDPIAHLSFAAPFTNTMKLGTCVMVSTLRTPVLFAKDVATLDRLSGGRFIAGIGIGARLDHEAALGLPSSDRAARFEEGITLAKRLWTGDSVSFQGRWWQLDGLSIGVKPTQVPHPPIWFGGGSPAALKRAARMGDGWIGAGTAPLGSFRRQIRRMREILDAEGRDPASFVLAKRAYVAVDADREGASRKLREWFGRVYRHAPGVAEMGLESAVFGTEQECIDQLGEIVSEGIELLIVNPIYDLMEQMERLAAAVLPRLR